MADNNGLPRLGSTQDSKPDLKTQVVVIPDRGVSVVLKKPSVGMIVEAQEELNLETTDIKEGYLSTVNLVSRMMVEPKLTPEALKTEVDDWSFSDWQVLQGEALKLAGMREEDEQTARAEFRGKE